MRVALVGHTGYWGEKFKRVIGDLGWDVVSLIDRSNTDELDASNADAAIIATPPQTHYELAMRAMRAGMHVLVEKPMAMSSSEAEHMVDFAVSSGSVLSVDSTFVHTETYGWLIDQIYGALNNDLYSYQSIRLAPAMPQAVIPAGWDLIVHDLSILTKLSTIDGNAVGAEDGDVAQAALSLPNGGSAFIMASRAWHQKVREITLEIGDETFIWTLDGLRTREGKTVVQETNEPLRSLLEDFAERVANHEIQGLTDGAHGLKVVRCLERLFPSHSPGQARSSRVGTELCGLPAF